jgi:hypothetical protein
MDKIQLMQKLKSNVLLKSTFRGVKAQFVNRTCKQIFTCKKLYYVLNLSMDRPRRNAKRFPTKKVEKFETEERSVEQEIKHDYFELSLARYHESQRSMYVYMRHEIMVVYRMFYPHGDEDVERIIIETFRE